MTIEISEYVIDAIADAVVKKMQKPKTGHWIPVSERLPKDDDYKPCIYNIDDGAVLWQDSKGNIGLGWYYNSTGVWADLDDYCPKNKVVAWMPLPEPMQADKENTK